MAKSFQIFFSLFSIFAIISCTLTDSYTEETVIFVNDVDGAILEGTLTIPTGNDDYPIAVFISGSGSQDRDETVYGHKPFKVLSNYLADQGIASLRFDDRGTGGSKGDSYHVSLELLAEDAYAGIRYLLDREDLKGHPIGIIGHSIGAVQGTILAATKSEISFLIMLGGLGIPWSENHMKSDSVSNTIKGERTEIVDAGSDLLRKVFHIISLEDDPARAKPAVNMAIHEWRNSLTGDMAESMREFARKNPEFWTDFAENYSSPLFLSCAKFDPKPYLIEINCDVLSIIGEKDVQTLPENNMAIAKLLKQGGNDSYAIITPENINHLMQHCETGLIGEYETIEEDFNEEVLKAIANWILSIQSKD